MSSLHKIKYQTKKTYGMSNKARKKTKKTCHFKTNFLRNIKYKQKGGAYYLDNREKFNDTIQNLIISQRMRFDLLEPKGTKTCDFYELSQYQDLTPDNYQKSVQQCLEDFNRDTKPKLLTHFSVHSRYFDFGLEKGSLNYFVVPSNIIICLLTPPDVFGVVNNLKTHEFYKKHGMFDTLFEYRGKLKKEEFYYKYYHKLYYDMVDFFKFSNWFYPGQLCHNFLIYLSKQEVQKSNSTCFDIFKREGKDFSCNHTIKKLIKLFPREDGTFQIDGQKMCCNLETGYKYIIVIDACNLTQTTEFKDVSHLTQDLYQLHHLNQWVVQQSDDKTPPPQKTINFKFNQIRRVFDSLYRHSRSLNPSSSVNERFLTTYTLDVSQKRNFNRNYKIELFYEIFELLKGTRDDVSNMTEYVSFIQYLSIPEMFFFLNMLIQKLSESGAYEKENILYFLKLVFGKEMFLELSQINMLKMFRIFRTFKHTGIPGEEVESSKRYLQTLIRNYIEYMSYIQQGLEMLGIKGDFDSFQGYLVYLNSQGNDYKYIIKKGVFTGPPIFKIESTKELFLVNSILIESTIQFDTKSSLDDIKLNLYNFKSLKIVNSNTSQFDDTGIEYNDELSRGLLECVVTNSFFQASPQCTLLRYIKKLWIYSLKTEQNKLRIGHFFHHLEFLSIKHHYHLHRIEIENNKLIDLELESPQIIGDDTLTVHIRATNLQSIKMTQFPLENLYFHNCELLHTLTLLHLDLNADSINLVFSHLPKLKKLRIENCQGMESEGGEGSKEKNIKLPPQLEDIVVHNLSNCSIDLSNTTLEPVKHISMNNFSFNLNSIQEIDEGNEFTGFKKFPRYKLEYLYVLLDYINPESYQQDFRNKFEEYLMSINSRILARTQNDDEYQRFFL